MQQPRNLNKAPEPPDASAGFYAVHITVADADAFEAFLLARLEEVAARYRPGTAEARVTQALHEAASARIDDLRASAHSNGPSHLIPRLEAWNHLVRLTEPWRGTEGHNGEHWRLVAHANE